MTAGCSKFMFMMLTVALAAVVLVSYPDFALAGEAAGHGAEHGGGHESSGGLPQMNPAWYPSQLFWLFVTFSILFVAFSRKILPEISSVLENRRVHIESDLETAEKLRAEAEAVQKTYETGLSSARAESTALAAGVHEQMQATATLKMTAFREKADSSIKTLEVRLGKARNDAMEDMNTIAAEVAAEAAKRIVGISTDLDQAKTVVRAINDREAA